MIKIHDRLWFVKNPKKEGNLAYMCPYEETQSGEISPSTLKMQNTGRRWAENKTEGSGSIIENVPTSGLYIGNSVSRWSTSNKLFRVVDLRGFTVEIPTDNLATLLHHTTVVRGVVQEECVWGRDGGNHILLPVNSEPYLEAMSLKNTLKNDLIPLKNLKAGDWVRLFGSDTEYYFYGRVKVKWKVRGYRPKSRRGVSWSSNSLITYPEEFTEWVEIEDSKYVNLFLVPLLKNTYGEWCAETPVKPQIVEIIRNEDIKVDVGTINYLHCPERVSNKLDEIFDTSFFHLAQSEIISINRKGEK